VVDELAHFLLGLSAPVGDAADQLPVEIRVQRLRHLPMSRRIGVLAERVRVRLVFADVQRVGERADLVERASEEQFVARDAGEIEARGRHQEHLVAGAGQVELLLAAVLEEPDDRLAGAAEIADRVADFLDLPPQRGRARRAYDDARDALVDFRLAQRFDHRTDSGARLEELPDDTSGLGVLEVAADFEDERGVAGDPRLAADEQRHRHQCGRGRGDREDDQDDDDPDAALHGGSISLRGVRGSGLGARELPIGPGLGRPVQISTATDIR
jgi:hypothetical protein